MQNIIEIIDPYLTDKLILSLNELTTNPPSELFIWLEVLFLYSIVYFNMVHMYDAAFMATLSHLDEISIDYAAIELGLTVGLMAIDSNYENFYQ